MRMRTPTHLQERDQVLLLWGWSLVFRWHLRVSGGGSENGYLNHPAPYADCLSSVENVAEKTQFKRGEMLTGTEAAQIQIEGFSGTYNWTLSMKLASAQHESYS
jgi:hypothetical protein